jgi:two-component system, NtrC family, sensor histidine kinase HydH
MERVLTSGPDLAMPRRNMTAPARAQLGTVALPAEAGTAILPTEAPPVPAVPLVSRTVAVLPLAYHAVVVALLAAAGYSGWRLGVVALAAALQRVNCLAVRARAPRCVNADAAQLARFAAISHAVLVVTTGVAVAVTGGIRSPLLVTVVCGYFGAVTAVGDRRETRLLLGATGLGVAALAMVPRAWTGPELPGPIHALLTAVGVVGVGALLAPVLASMRKKREELARAREELASDALARARALEQVGSKVAHELKNPLTGVKALVQLGLRSPAEAASHARLEVVDREVTRMQEILQNYLSFTRPLQAVTPQRIALAPLVSETLLVLSARADEAHVRLFALGDATAQADPRRLKEALLNLVANAIEATPPGGEVVVEVRQGRDDTEILVRDTGRGMPADTLRRIGTPFFTTRDTGTGLGVVLARSVIAQHGGSLRYESEPGNGTRVRVTLPRVAPGVHDGPCAARR